MQTDCKGVLTFLSVGTFLLHVLSLLQQQSAAFHQRALRCPGFLHSATLWYLAALRLFLDGEAPASVRQVSEVLSGHRTFRTNSNCGPVLQVEPTRVLDRTKQFVLSLIRQAPAAALSCSQWRQVTP